MFGGGALHGCRSRGSNRAVRHNATREGLSVRGYSRSRRRKAAMKFWRSIETYSPGLVSAALSSGKSSILCGPRVNMSSPVRPAIFLLILTTITFVIVLNTEMPTSSSR
jgi:hypothetical protein